MPPRARPVTAKGLAAASTVDAEWEDTYSRIIAAGDKADGAVALLGLAMKAGITGLPKQTAARTSAAVVAAIRRAAESRADAAKVSKARAAPKRVSEPSVKKAKVTTPATVAKDKTRTAAKDKRAAATPAAEVWRPRVTGSHWSTSTSRRRRGRPQAWPFLSSV